MQPPSPRPSGAAAPGKGTVSDEHVYSNCMADTCATGARAGASTLTGGLSRAAPRVRPLQALSPHPLQREI